MKKGFKKLAAKITAEKGPQEGTVGRATKRDFSENPNSEHR